MPIAIVVVSLASMAISAYGSYKAGKQAKKAGEQAQAASNDQAEITDYNAEVAELQATDAVERGVEEESRFRTSIRGTIGSQRAEIAGGNVDVGYGSAVDVQGDIAYLGELDALTIKTNAAREAWGYKVQAEDLRRRAVITRKEGVNQAEAGRQNAQAAYIGGAANLLGGGASLLQAKYGFGKGGK